MIGTPVYVVMPPMTATFPFGSNVAVCPTRGVDNVAVRVANEFDAALYVNAVLRAVIDVGEMLISVPPTNNVVPFGNAVRV